MHKQPRLGWRFRDAVPLRGRWGWLPRKWFRLYPDGFRRPTPRGVHLVVMRRVAERMPQRPDLWARWRIAPGLVQMPNVRPQRRGADPPPRMAGRMIPPCSLRSSHALQQRSLLRYGLVLSLPRRLIPLRKLHQLCLGLWSPFPCRALVPRALIPRRLSVRSCPHGGRWPVRQLDLHPGIFVLQVVPGEDDACVSLAC